MLALTWVAATLVAVFVALQAVGAVGRQVTDRPAALTHQTTTTTAPSSASPSSSTTATSTTTTTTAAAPPSTTLSTDPTAPEPPPTEPPEQTQSSPPESESSASSSPPVTAAPPAPGPTTTYNLEGGSIGVRCTSPSSIELVYSSPAPGFGAEVDNSGPQEVEVRFENDEHHSRIRVQCTSGAPVVIDEHEEDT